MIALVFGLPATGKSFFAKKFAEEIGAVHLNTDIVRGKLNFEGYYDEKTKQQVYNELFKQAKLEIKKGSDLILDGTFHKKKRRKQVERMGVETNQEVFFIEMKAGEGTIKNRLKKDRRYSEADWDVYEKLRDNYEPPAQDILELNSDEMKMEDMIALAKTNFYG